MLFNDLTGNKLREQLNQPNCKQEQNSLNASLWSRVIQKPPEKHMYGQAQLIPETVFRVWKFSRTLHHTEGKVVASTAHIWNWFETNTKENQFWSRRITMLVNSLLRIIILRHTQHRYIFFRDWILGHAHPITKTRPLSCKHYSWDRESLWSTIETTLQYLNQCGGRLCSTRFILGFCCCVGLLCFVR